MKKIIGFIFALVIIGITPVMAHMVQNKKIDLIMTNGQIKTPTGWVEAMAIRDGIIVALGKNDAIRSMATTDTKTINLKGSAVLPGLDDSHVHPLFAGMEQFACGLKPSALPKLIAAALKKCVSNKKAGEWLLGGNWVSAVFKAGEQNKAFLDAISPNNPVMLTDEAHHSIWVNSKALELAAITRDTPNPTDGIIERDASGEPNGLLREEASRLVQNIVPQASEDAKRKALILSTSQMLSYGITSFTVASVRAKNIGPLSDLSAEGLIKQRVRGCIVWTEGNEKGKSVGEKLIENREAYRQPRFSLDCVKIFMDGVPTESHTAAMLEPYVDTHKAGGHNRPEKGMLMVPQDILAKVVTLYDSQGLNIKFHAAGDGAVRAALDAVATARKINGFGGPSHHIAHSTFVNINDIPRVRNLHMTWEFSPYIWYPTSITDDIVAAVGAERMKRWMPIKEAMLTGAPVVVGSDWSVVPSVNPWLAMETLVTRQKPGGSKETVGEQEKITRDQAFRVFTVNGAELMGHRNIVGAIEIGMHADVIVTEKNPFTVPITQLHNTKVKMTFIDGEKVFDAAFPPQLTAN